MEKEFSNNFLSCLKKVLSFEGGYVNDPDDPGAETIFGISRKFHPDWKGWVKVDSIENKKGIELKDLQDEVADFYHKKFYNKMKCDQIEKIDPELACNVFDFGVNSGTHTSIKALQNAINKEAINLNMINIVVDGLIGNQTLKAIQYIKDNGEEEIIKLIHYFKEYRVKYYIEITKNKPVFLKYLVGWTNRAFNA